MIERAVDAIVVIAVRIRQKIRICYEEQGLITTDYQYAHCRIFYAIGFDQSFNRGGYHTVIKRMGKVDSAT